MKKKIIDYLLKNRKGTLNEISEETEISSREVFEVLNELIKKRIVTRININYNDEYDINVDAYFITPYGKKNLDPENNPENKTLTMHQSAHQFYNSPIFNEKFEETYQGAPLLDYEKLKRWARWIVGRVVFEKIIFGMTDTSDRINNWFDSSWNKIDQLRKHSERRDFLAGVYYIRKKDKIIKHYSWKCEKKFPEIRFLLYSELFKYVKMGLVYTVKKDYYNKHCRKGWETEEKTLYYADIETLMLSVDNAYGNIAKETIEVKYPKFI